MANVTAENLAEGALPVTKVIQAEDGGGPSEGALLNVFAEGPAAAVHAQKLALPDRPALPPRPKATATHALSTGTLPDTPIVLTEGKVDPRISVPDGSADLSTRDPVAPSDRGSTGACSDSACTNEVENGDSCVQTSVNHGAPAKACSSEEAEFAANNPFLQEGGIPCKKDCSSTTSDTLLSAASELSGKCGEYLEVTAGDGHLQPDSDKYVPPESVAVHDCSMPGPDSPQKVKQSDNAATVDALLVAPPLHHSHDVCPALQSNGKTSSISASDDISAAAISSSGTIVSLPQCSSALEPDLTSTDARLTAPCSSSRAQCGETFSSADSSSEASISFTRDSPLDIQHTPSSSHAIEAEAAATATIATAATTANTVTTATTANTVTTATAATTATTPTTAPAVILPAEAVSNVPAAIVPSSEDSEISSTSLVGSSTTAMPSEDEVGNNAADLFRPLPGDSCVPLWNTFYILYSLMWSLGLDAV